MIRFVKHNFFSLLLFIIMAGCAYYNIMFNAEERYEAGLKKIELSRDGEITPEIRNDFYKSIDKCWKLINLYGDSSAYAADALLLIGKCHYLVEEYLKSERHLRQFVDRYKKSDLIVEGYLWLGKSLLALDRDDEALEYLNEVLAADENDDLNSKAYFYMGKTYYKKEAYDLARTQFLQSIDQAKEEDIRANAQYLIAESYFNEKNYVDAATNYILVSEYNTSDELQFQSKMRSIKCLVELKQYDQVIERLEAFSLDPRFLYKKSVIEAEIGNCYKIQGKSLEATEKYIDVMEIYPRSEGSAMAAFGMAQIMEFAYADLDSAKSLYQRVTKEYRDSEFKSTADDRAKLIDEYQKINANIKKDLNDLKLLAEQINGDSVITDVIENADESQNEGSQTSVKKKENRRSESEIKSSLEKNKFALAEFFLLNLGRYDWAAKAYTNFIESSEDSILVPKAHYALYYIYHYELSWEEKADSVKQILLSEFAQTPYARYLSANKSALDNDVSQKSPYKYLYLQAEGAMSEEDYSDAIDLFNQIAEEDSGSLLAQKSRYAVAWIYENKLEDIQGAVEAYNLVAEEYPQSEVGGIAKNKIRTPVEEPSTTDSLNVILPDSVSTDTLQSIDDKLKLEDNTLQNQFPDSSDADL